MSVHLTWPGGFYNLYIYFNNMGATSTHPFYTQRNLPKKYGFR